MASIDMLRNDPATTSIAAGRRIFAEGEQGEIAFVVTEGEVELSIHGKPVETVAAGGMFGEMALIDHKTRSASATAKTDAKVVPIDQRRFLYLIANTPFFAIEVMHLMAERIRRMDANV